MLTVLYILMILAPFAVIVAISSYFSARREREREARWNTAVKAPVSRVAPTRGSAVRRSRGSYDSDEDIADEVGDLAEVLLTAAVVDEMLDNDEAVHAASEPNYDRLPEPALPEPDTTKSSFFGGGFSGGGGAGSSYDSGGGYDSGSSYDSGGFDGGGDCGGD